MVDVNMILELAKEKPSGLSNNDIQTMIPGAKLADIADAINKCLRTGSLELYQNKGKLLYKYKDLSKANSTKGLDCEEKVVFQLIEEAGNKGIWIRDIRYKSNLNMTQLNKVLKSLETKKAIKAVKSVAASKKKVYMLYNLEPDSTITGGAWYQDQDFESEFVDVLNQQCLRFLTEKAESAKSLGPILGRKKSYATVEEVHEFISELKISKVSLAVGDIESILYTIVLDNKAERIYSGDSYLYRAANGFIPSTGIIKTPCGMCPIEERCSKNGKINPKVCEYLNEWLDN
ncbi:probable DNA-directed RNA polymerase III subunit RPC6 [Coccinella septempunctata]|uniref:probable DNA-directed RNA polymerase III subunit RPC6 n=1 Tax=Coccinella septempunctata TaxID=41139 RepID=UPI001D094DE8|nr:probable DNA-directed RNA polymerase III subunit RPC6 [Coccinella septempunctata]